MERSLAVIAWRLTCPQSHSVNSPLTEWRLRFLVRQWHKLNRKHMRKPSLKRLEKWRFRT